ncbi:hypothetical protein ABZ917_07145 [Nonomuraea wenchangensis]
MAPVPSTRWTVSRPFRSPAHQRGPHRRNRVPFGARTSKERPVSRSTARSWLANALRSRCAAHGQVVSVSPSLPGTRAGVPPVSGTRRTPPFDGDQTRESSVTPNAVTFPVVVATRAAVPPVRGTAQKVVVPPVVTYQAMWSGPAVTPSGPSLPLTAGIRASVLVVRRVRSYTSSRDGFPFAGAATNSSTTARLSPVTGRIRAPSAVLAGTLATACGQRSSARGHWSSIRGRCSSICVHRSSARRSEPDATDRAAVVPPATATAAAAASAIRTRCRIRRACRRAATPRARSTCSTWPAAVRRVRIRSCSPLIVPPAALA